MPKAVAEAVVKVYPNKRSLNLVGLPITYVGAFLVLQLCYNAIWVHMTFEMHVVGIFTNDT